MASRSDINKIKVKRLSISVLYHAKTRNSTVWKYFGDLVLHENDNKKKKIIEDQVFCTVCLDSAKESSDDVLFGSIKIKAYSRTASTGNLLRHLREDHQIKFEIGEKSLSNIKTFFRVDRMSKSTTSLPAGLSKSKQNSSTNKWLLARDLALWFCKSLLPFDSVSDEGMVDFFKKYNIIVTSADLPSRDTVGRTGLDDVYYSMLSNVKDQILADKAFQLAMTFDLWTDGYRRLNYITFTLHYLTSDFELKTLTLKTELMEGKKTGEKIKEAIDNTKKEFALCDKKLFLVTDAGSNVKRAVRLANTESHLCLGHGLHNLVTIDGIKKVPEIDALVTKCKKVVKAVRYRLPDLEKEADSQMQYFHLLENAARTIEADENDPISDDEQEQVLFTQNYERHQIGELDNPIQFNLDHVPSIKSATPTRWHSVLEMLESMIHCCNRSPINEMLQKIGQSDLRITQAEWNLLEDLVKFLSKFREAVTILSSQKACTLNVALVFKSEIKDVLSSIPDDETLIMLSLKRNMIEQVDKRFPTTKATVAAALLDYRFMGLTEIDVYLEKQNMTRASFLAGYYNDIVGTSESEITQAVVPSTSTGLVHKTKDTSSSQLLLKLAKKHCSYNSLGFQNEDAVDQETWKYLVAADHSELDDGDLLSFWKNRTTSFPLLSTLARAMLCVPATSTPSERVFSVAGLVLTAKRSRLMPQRVNKIIFIHDNYRVCKDCCSESSGIVDADAED